MSAPTPTLPGPGLASRRWRGAWVRLLVATVLGVAVDLISKAVAFASIAEQPVTIRRSDVLAAGADGVRRLVPPHEPVTVAPHLLEFRLVLNPGAVFGMGPGRRWFFVGFSIVAVAMGLWAFARWTRPRDRWAHVGLGLIFSGAIGNLYDRVRFGVVRDFLHPLPGVNLPFGWAWPSGAREVWPWVSNVADAALLAGIAILVVHLWRADAGRAARSAADAGSA